MTNTTIRSAILGCVALYSMVACDQSSDITTLRSKSSGEKIWLSSDRPALNEAPVPMGLELTTSNPEPKDPIIAIDAQYVCNGVKYRNIKGEPQIGSNTSCDLADCSANGAVNCRATTAFRPVNTSTLEKDKIVKGYKIAGVEGTFDAGAYTTTACSETGDTNCTVKSANDLFTVSRHIVKKENIKKGKTIGKITGVYPSSSAPMSTTLPAGTKALTAAKFTDAMKDGGKKYVYWNRKGEQQIFVPDVRFVAENILKDKTIYGLTGNYDINESTKFCSKPGDSDCVIQSPYVAVNKTLLAPQYIKKGASIAGIVGKYGSAEAPLDLEGGQDLDMNNLSASTLFVVFNKNGDKISLPGAPDLQDSNILSGKSIFHVNGTLNGVDFSSVRTIDVRDGVAIGTSGKKGSAKLQASCTNHSECVGEGKPWLDVTNATISGGGTCASGQDYCVFRNQFQQLDWAFPLNAGKKTWVPSVNYCNSLKGNTIDKRPWRLATLKEVQIAAAQSLHKLGHYEYYSPAGIANREYWTSTINYAQTSNTPPPDKDWKMAYLPQNNRVWSNKHDKPYDVACVREVAP